MQQQNQWAQQGYNQQQNYPQQQNNSQHQWGNNGYNQPNNYNQQGYGNPQLMKQSSGHKWGPQQPPPQVPVNNSYGNNWAGTNNPYYAQNVFNYAHNNPNFPPPQQGYNGHNQGWGAPSQGAMNS